MRVLMLGPSRNSMGGIATVIKNFHDYFKDDEIEIIYMETWKEGSLGQRLIFTFKMLFKLVKIILSKKIDLLHIHVAQDGSFYRKAVIIIIGRLFRKKILLHIHASQFDKFYEKSNALNKCFIRKILNLPHRLIVLSEEWKKFISNITTNEIVILHNAVLVEEYQYNNNGNIITFMGRLCKRKGIYDVLDIANELFNENKDIKLYLCGDGDIEKVNEIIRKKNLESNIIVTGWINKEEKQEILKNTIINILPSYNEGMPMAILETMARGIPNISTNVGGISTVISSMKNGVVIKSGDSNTLLNSIKFLANYSNIRSAMSRKAYDTIKNDYSIENFNDKVKRMYNSIYRN